MINHNIIEEVLLGFILFLEMMNLFMINHNINIGGWPCKVQKVKISLFILLKQEKNKMKLSDSDKFSPISFKVQ